MNRPKRIMSYTEFKGIIDQVRRHVVEIMLWNYGEPFLNRELLPMIKYATSAGMHVMTSTNGEFLKSEEFCVQIVQSGLQHLIICLDGVDQETLSKFRRGSNFSEIMNGFRFMHAAKKKLAAKTPIIELQFIVMKHNEYQRNYVKQLATELQVDIFCEKTVGLGYLDAEGQQMAKELLPNDLSASRYYLKEDGTVALKGEISNSCAWLNYLAVVNSDGTVVPCCIDVYSEYVMGNIFEEGLKTIWKNDKYQSFRRQVRRDRKSIPMCNICSEGRYTISRADPVLR